MKKQQRFMKSGKLLLSLGMVFTMLTPANVFANEPVTPSDGEKTDVPIGEVSTPNQDNGTDSGIMPMAFDTTAPVIEDVQFPQNGQTFNAGDTVEVFVKAYDDSKEISSVVILVSYMKGDRVDLSYSYDKFTKTENENEYKVEFSVSSSGYDSAKIYGVVVSDKMGNEVKKIFTENDPSLEFSIENKEVEIKYNLEVDSFEFKQNKQVLQRGDEIEATVTLKGNNLDDVHELVISFHNNKEGKQSSFESMWLTNMGSGVFKGKRNVSEFIHNGTYYLDEYINLRGEYDGETSLKYVDASDTYFQLEGIDDVEAPIIENIEMDKNSGDILTAGDSVTFKIKVKDNLVLDTSSARIYLAPATNVHGGMKEIQLLYIEEDDVFIGTFDINDSTYPTEWYLQRVYVRDTFGNVTNIVDYDADFNTTSPFYFYVKNGDTLTNETYDLDIEFNAITEDGYYTEIKKLSLNDVERRTSYKDAGLTYPKVESVKGMQVIGWRTSDGKVFDENFPVLSSDSYLRLYAVYDKTYTSIHYQYPSKDGSINYVNDKLLLENGTTYRYLYELAKDYKPADMDERYTFEGWEVLYGKNLDEIANTGSGLNVIANFGDKIFIQKTHAYYNEKGIFHYNREIEFIEKGMQRSVINKEMKSKKVLDLFKGLRLKDWDLYYYEGEIKNGDTFYANAEYENCMIRFGIDDAFRPKDNKQMRGAAGGVDDSKLDSLYAIVVEYGDTFAVPEISGYKNITWLEPKPEGEYLVANGDRDFYGYGDKDGSNNNNDNNVPDDNNKPDDSNNNNGNDDNSNTDNGNNGGNIDQETNNGIELPDTVIVNTIHSIINAPVGEKIEVNMGNATVVPVDVLAAAKGKDVDVVLNMGGYSWTINGKDILASNLKDINLEVKMDTQAVPSKLIQTLAGDNPTKQLSLTHNGDFGFKASLNLNIGSEYTGKYGNLYYYDSDGKLKFMNAGEIDANGNVSLEFSHASDYVIIINDQIMEEPIKDTATNSTQDPLFAMMVFCLLGCGYYVLSKKADSVSGVK